MSWCIKFFNPKNMAQPFLILNAMFVVGYYNVVRRPVLGKLILKTFESINFSLLDQSMLDAHGIERLINFQVKFGLY